MPPTRDDWLKSLPARRRESALADAQRLAGTVHAAAVSAANLTGQPDWDRFLSYLQAALEGAEADRRALLDKLADPMMIDPQEIARTRAQAGVQAIRIQMLAHVIALPKALMADGEKARGLLDLLKDEEPADAA